MRNFIKKLLIILLLILFVFLLYRLVLAKFLNQSVFEKEMVKLNQRIQDSPFSISKIVLYHSAYGENQNTTFQKSSWILNLLQYSDIAIYLEHSGKDLNAANTIKKLYLENIQISAPKLGAPSLYYLDALHFGSANFNPNDQLQDSIEFTVLNDENQNNEIQSNTPVFFTDCSNPITLKYINNPVLENYIVTANEPIFFDGRLLKMANISLQDLKTTIRFTIHLQSNNSVDYFYDLSLPINFEDENASIYNGSILMEKDFENYKFLENPS